MKKSIVQSLKGIVFTGAVTAGLLFAGAGASAAEPGPVTQVGGAVIGAVSEVNGAVNGVVAGVAPVVQGVPVVGGTAAAVAGQVVGAKDSTIGTVAAAAVQVAGVADGVVGTALGTVGGAAGVAAPVLDTVTGAAGAVTKADVATTASAADTIIPDKPVAVTGNVEFDGSVKKYEKSALLNVNLQSDLLRPITGDVDVDVLGDTKVVTDKGTMNTKGLVQADLTDSQLLGDTHAGVLETKEVKTKDYTQTYQGAVNVDINGSIVGDAHAGVLEKESIETKDYTWTHNGVVVVDTKGTPIVGDLHAGVLENENYVPKNTSNPGTDNPGTPGTDNPGTPGTDNPGTDNPGTPGTNNPGTDKPGTDKPGTDKPGTDNTKPGTTNPGSSDKDNGSKDNGTKLSDNKVNKSLPKTGSAFDTSILLIAASLIMALGLVFRKLNRA